jgi:hypothetical protein
MLIFGEDEAPEYASGSCGTRVEVSKMGGGTVGKEYVGRWHYAVFDVLGTLIASGDDYVTGMPHTHRWVARDIGSLYLDDVNGSIDAAHKRKGEGGA